MVNNEIENATYKKWFKKFSVQKSISEAEIMELNKENNGNLSRAVRLIPALLDLKAIFKKATIFQMHSILREVFKGGLTYVGDAFRTPFLHPARFMKLLQLLEESGDIEIIQVPFFNYKQKRILPRRPSNVIVFEKEEIVLINDVLKKIGEMSAKEASDLTHILLAWEL